MGFRCSLCCLVKGCRPTWLSGKELAGGCAFSGAFKSAAERQIQTPKWGLHLQILHAGGSKGKDLPQRSSSWGVVVAVRASSYLGTPQTPEGEASFAGSPFVPQYCHAPVCSNAVEPQYGSSRRSHRALPQNVTLPTNEEADE